MAPTDTTPQPTIGGHFSALLVEHDHAPPGRYGYQSARSCLFALLRERAPAKVHIPNYVCSAVRQAVDAAGCVAQSYEINNDFTARDVSVAPDEIIVLVNYFGLCDSAIEMQLGSIPRNRVVVDNSQAYFQPPYDALATIYSPRKFLPVPDGGFIETAAPLRQDAPDEGGSLKRFGYLLQRVGQPPHVTRPGYLAAEEELETPSLAGMSQLTRAWIAAQDHGAVRVRRRANYAVLASRFPNNRLAMSLGTQAPLCYPLAVPDGRRLHERLAAQGIYCPRYWPDLKPLNDFERALLDQTAYLPVDHRYSEQDMSRMADVVMNMEAETRG